MGKPWSKKEVETVRTLARQGLTRAQIVEKTRPVSAAQITRLCRKHGIALSPPGSRPAAMRPDRLPKQPPQYRRWRENNWPHNMTAELLACAMRGMTIKAARDRIARKFNVSFTKSAIIGKLYRLRKG